MIYGIGTDITHMPRIAEAIETYGDRFLDRCFTPAERARTDKRNDPAKAYARLYAAKEALLKALGTGMREGLSWHDWEIMPNELGAPQVTMQRGALALFGDTHYRIHLSMSDDGEYAVAYAILEKTS